MLRSVLSVLLILATAAFPQAGDWPCFLGLNGDQKSSETGLVSNIPPQGLPIVFDRPVGTGYSAPSVGFGRLVLFHRLGGEEIVEAWNSDTAVPLWRSSSATAYQDPYGYNNGPRCTPLLTSNRVYTFGAEGRLSCLDLADGSVIWRRNTSEDAEVPEAFFGVGSTPILEGGRLIVQVGGQPNSGVIAYDPNSGKPVWRSVGETNWQGQPMHGWPGDRKVEWRRWDKQASYSSPVATTVQGRRVVYCLMRQGLVALDPADGKVLFSRWFRARVEESVNAANPVVAGAEVLISSAYYRTGSVLLEYVPGQSSAVERWSGLGLEAHWSTPVLLDGYLYGFSGRNEPDARLRCVEWKTGTVAWDRDEHWEKHSSAQPSVFGRGSFLYADGRLYALGEGGLLGIFRPSPTACEEISRWQVPSLHYPCWAGPVLSNGRMYLRSEDRLVCLDLRGNAKLK
jgi:outer membrane protein assembly factor BamB